MRRAALVALLLLGLGEAGPFSANRAPSGQALHWPAASMPLSFVINDQGSDDIPDDAERLAIRLGFTAWEQVDGTSLSFSQDDDPISEARTDWESDDLHLVLFDESNSTGLFPQGAGLVATVVYEFDTVSAELIDADVLFNGAEFTFAAGIEPGGIDVRGVATHEVGHFIGLGHSAIAGATMAPFFAPGDFSRRTLDLDDEAAAVSLYPLTLRGRLTGAVQLNGLPVAGAHVWASGGNGIVAGSTLSEADGSFALEGLLPNDYRVIAAPLDLPFTPDALGLIGFSEFNTSFRQSSVSTFSILGVESVQVGVIAVGDDSALEPAGPFTVQVVERGSVKHFDLTVNGIVGGTPTVSVPSSGSLSVSGVTFQAGNQLGFDVTVPIGTPPGTYDLQFATNIGTTTSLPGFLEIVPKAPVLTGLFGAPPVDCGGTQSGLEVIVQGTNLPTVLGDVELLFGDEQGAVTIVTPGGVRVGAVPPPNQVGPVDLVLVNAQGQEARLEDIYSYVDGGVLVLDSILPPAADKDGGATIVMGGEGFGEATRVSLGATVIDPVVEDSQTLHFVLPPLSEGPHDVGLFQDGCVVTGFFVFEPAAFEAVDADDPVLLSVTPDGLSQVGGQAITLDGSGFVPGSVVEMFADPRTGLGGTPLATAFVSANQLTATTPAGPLPGGPADFLVRNPALGGTGLQQVAVLEDGAVVEAPEIYAVVPAVVGRSGGVTLTVSGFGFVPGAVVSLGADLGTFTGGTALPTTFVSDALLTAELPVNLAPWPAGPINVSVEFPGPMFAGDAGGLTFVEPSLSSFVPGLLAPLGNQVVRLQGFGFAEPSTVRILVDSVDFSGGLALATTVIDQTELEALVPTGALPAGPVSVAVDLPGGLLLGLADVATVPAPLVGEVEPTTLYETGGEAELLVTGVGFLPGAQVRLFANLGDFSGGLALPTELLTSKLLRAVVPSSLAPLPLGLADLAVVMPGPQSAGLAAAVEVLPAELSGVAPNSASTAGVDSLTLTGAGFVADAVVRLFVDPLDFSGGTALVTTFVSGNELQAQLPAGPLPPGPASVAVDLAGGAVLLGLADALELFDPTIDSVEPLVISSDGGDLLTVRGSGFIPGAVVELFTDPLTFSGGTALATTFVDASTLTANTPIAPLPLGPANVAVRLPNDVVVLLEAAVDVAALLNNGNKAGGSLGDDDEFDLIGFEGLAGSLITVTHRRVGKSDLVPKLVLLDEADVALVSTDASEPSFDPDLVKSTDSTATLRNVPLPDTGRYTLRVTRLSGAGSYALTFREKLPKSALVLKVTKQDGVILGPDDASFEVDLKAGTTASGVFKGIKKEGLRLVLESLTGPDEVVLLSTDVAGNVHADPDLVARVTLGKELISIKLKAFPLGDFGTHRLVLAAAPDTSGTVTGSLRFKAPKVKQSLDGL